MGEEQILCVCWRHLELGLYFQWLQGKQRRNKAHSEFLRGPILQGLPKVKISSDFSSVHEKWTIFLTRVRARRKNDRKQKSVFWCFVKAEFDLSYLPSSFSLLSQGLTETQHFGHGPAWLFQSLLTLSNHLTFPIHACKAKPKEANKHNGSTVQLNQPSAPRGHQRHVAFFRYPSFQENFGQKEH